MVDLPPSFDEVVCCVLRGVGPRVEDDCVHLREVAMLPRFDGTDEVDYLRISPKSEGEGAVEERVDGALQQFSSTLQVCRVRLTALMGG